MGPSENTYLTVYSDAGFKKQETDGYGIRGAVYLRTNEEILSDSKIRGRDVRVHLLHAESKSLKQVCRSTYAAELLASAGSLDSLVPLSVTMYERFNLVRSERPN